VVKVVAEFEEFEISALYENSAWIFQGILRSGKESNILEKRCPWIAEIGLGKICKFKSGLFLYIAKMPFILLFMGTPI
jgi:hypothetical protein